MRQQVEQLAVLAAGLAADRVFHIGEDYRCGECMRAWTDPVEPAHAQHCVVGKISQLAAEVTLALPAKPLPTEAEVMAMLASRREKPSQVPAGLRNRTSCASDGEFAEPWRVATSSETDPCRRWAGALVNARDEVIVELQMPHLDYHEVPSVLERIRWCVNFFAGVPTLEVIGSGELARERMAEVGGEGSALRAPVASGESLVASGAKAVRA